MNQTKKTVLRDNPYEKIFDDVKRRLEKSEYKDTLKKIDSYDSEELEPIPFPYGGYRHRSYNF